MPDDSWLDPLLERRSELGTLAGVCMLGRLTEGPRLGAL